MKTNLKLVVILLSAWSGAHAQVVPEATGPGKLPVGGDLQYALRYSQTAEFGGSLGNWQTGSPSASLDYSSGNARHPFTLDYTGGYTAHISGPTYGVGFFQHLMVSQGLFGRRWNFLVSDDVDYMPQSPTTGFSGVAGTGGPIGGSGSTPASNQLILTLNTHSVSNLANGEFAYHLDYATTLNVGGGSTLLRFPDSNGLDSDGLQANAGLTRRLDAKNSLIGKYVFSHYAYLPSAYSSTFTGGSPFSLDTNTVSFGYLRTWNREFTTNVSVGPQWLNSSNSALVPPTTAIAVDGGIDYRLRSNSARANYSHGSNGGSGYLLGATFDSVDGGYTRQFGRDLTLEFTGAYRRNAGLQLGTGVITARYGGTQVTRRFGRYLNIFATYTAIDQSTSSTAQTNILDQLYHVVSFGVAYAPREIHLKQ